MTSFEANIGGHFVDTRCPCVCVCVCVCGGGGGVYT